MSDCVPTYSIYRFMAATPGVFQLFKDARVRCDQK